MGVVCLFFGFCKAEQSVPGEPLATQVCRDVHLCVDSAEAWGADLPPAASGRRPKKGRLAPWSQCPFIMRWVSGECKMARAHVCVCVWWPMSEHLARVQLSGDGFLVFITFPEE